MRATSSSYSLAFFVERMDSELIYDIMCVGITDVNKKE